MRPLCTACNGTGCQICSGTGHVRGQAHLRLLAQELLREASRCDYQIVVASHVSPGVVGPVIELTPAAHAVDTSMLFSARMKVCKTLAEVSMAECCGDGNFCDFPWCDCTGNAAFRREHRMEKRDDPVQDCGQPCNTCRWTRTAQQAADGVASTRGGEHG